MTFVTDIKGIVSTDNSYEGTASSYSGTYEDVSQYTQITVTVYTEVGTSGSGLKLIFSSNNSDVDTEYIFTLLAGSRRIYTYTVVAKYFKVNFTGVSSGDIRIQTYFN